MTIFVVTLSAKLQYFCGDIYDPFSHSNPRVRGKSIITTNWAIDDWIVSFLLDTFVVGCIELTPLTTGNSRPFANLRASRAARQAHCALGGS